MLTSIFKFAKRQGYYFKDNPAAGRKILTKKQRAKNGFEIFEVEDIKKVFGAEFKIWEKKDPDFYFACVLGLVSGCRVSEITSLIKVDLRPYPVPHIKIRDSKTLAGIRAVPIPQDLFEKLQLFSNSKSKKEQIFKYQIRLGKGSGNAVGQKFGRHLDKLEIDNDKLVFHSLRKFFNDYCLKNGIPFELRCEIMGHEIDNVNVQSYTKKFTLEQIQEVFQPIQKRILNMVFEN